MDLLGNCSNILSQMTSRQVFEISSFVFLPSAVITFNAAAQLRYVNSVSFHHFKISPLLIFISFLINRWEKDRERGIKCVLFVCRLISLSTAEEGDFSGGEDKAVEHLKTPLMTYLFTEISVIYKGENMTQKACHSFLWRAIPISKGDHFLRTRVCVEHVGDIEVNQHQSQQQQAARHAALSTGGSYGSAGKYSYTRSWSTTWRPSTASTSPPLYATARLVAPVTQAEGRLSCLGI